MQYYQGRYAEGAKKFNLYISPNLKKDETARRIAMKIIDNPTEILSRLSKAELQIIDEFVKGDDTTYVVRKQRKTPYSLYRPKILYGCHI